MVSDQNPRGLADPGSPSSRYGKPIGLCLVAFVLVVGLVAIGQALGEGGPAPAEASSSSSSSSIAAAAAPGTAVADADTTLAAESPGSTAPGTTARRPLGPHCTFTRGITETCESRDAMVDLRVIFNADTRQCSFENAVDWGDGSGTERVAVVGAAAGARRVAGHTYHRAGRFAIRQQVRLVAGSCRVYEGSYTFSLLD